MNKLSLFLICLSTLVFTSCNFTEEITINQDGSGRMEFSFNADELMQMAGDEMAKGQKEAIDSTFSFKEVFDAKRDSISRLTREEQAKLKALEAFSMHMVMDPEAQKMEFEMFSDFENVNDLQDMFQAMNNVSNLQGSGPAKANDPNNPFSAMSKNGNTALSYTFKDNVFKRNVVVKDKEVQKQLADSLGQMAIMFASSKYKLKYHFPKKIKSVSHEAALFSEDRKTVTVEYGFMDYVTRPESLNLEVILEN